MLSIDRLNNLVFSLKVLTSSASVQFSYSEFQTVGVLIQKAFVDKAKDNLETVSKFLFEDFRSRTGRSSRAVTPLVEKPYQCTHLCLLAHRKRHRVH